MRFHLYGEEQKPVINMLGTICQNADYMSDETLEREADACVTFDYPAMDREFQKHLTLL